MSCSLNNGVYCLTSPSGKRYVGIAIRKDGIEGRWKEYRNFKCKDQPKLYNALKKYGPKNFKYEIILITDCRAKACSVERQLIALWNLRNDKYGYNITEGGDYAVSDAFKYSAKGKKWPDERRKKLSDKKKGVKRSLEFGIKVSNAKKGKMKYEDNKNSKIITLIHIKTGQTKTGLIQRLCEELKLCNCNIYHKYGSRGWKILKSDSPVQINSK